jgi:hypothetical protein
MFKQLDLTASIISLIPRLQIGESAYICSINSLAHIIDPEEIGSDSLLTKLKFLPEFVAHKFYLLNQALLAGNSSNTQSFRYYFMRNNQLTYFTATELVEVIAKLSANSAISLMIANKIKTQLRKIIKFYMECRTRVEKESASNALATLAMMAPEVNRTIREDDALCQCFQNDFLSPLSNKLKLNLLRIKCHIYINTCLTYTNNENIADIIRSESLRRFNEIISKLKNLYETYPHSSVLRDFLQTFSHQIHQNISTWARNINPSTIIIEDYVLLMLNKFLSSNNSNVKNYSIPTNQMICDGNLVEKTAEMENFLSIKIFENYFDDNTGAEIKKVKKCTIGAPQSVENQGLDNLFELEKMFSNKVEAKVIAKGLVGSTTAIGNILKRIDNSALKNFFNF